MTLKIKDLAKKFPKNNFYSLKNVDLTIEKGEIVGLIGKNGAGKSTFLKLIAKALRPTTGKIEYNGTDINSQKEVLKDFGIMIETVFYPEMTVMENMTFYLDLHHQNDYKNNIQKILELVGLWQAKDRKPGKFSFGMKQRMALALALVTEPKFLLLDEPFVGLDPIGVNNLIKILKEWSQTKEISMIISSHQLGELEELCNRYVYIEDGSVKDMFEEKIGTVLEVELTKVATDLSITSLPGVKFTTETTIEITTQDSMILNQVFGELGEKKLLSSVNVKENTLKKYFKN